MISDKITPTKSGDLSVTYKQLTSIVYVEVENIPEGKTIDNNCFFIHPIMMEVQLKQLFRQN